MIGIDLLANGFGCAAGCSTPRRPTLVRNLPFEKRIPVANFIFRYVVSIEAGVGSQPGSRISAGKFVRSDWLRDQLKKRIPVANLIFRDFVGILTGVGDLGGHLTSDAKRSRGDRRVPLFEKRIPVTSFIF